MNLRLISPMKDAYRLFFQIIFLTTLVFIDSDAPATTLEDCQYMTTNYQSQYPSCSVSMSQYSDGFQSRCKISKFCGTNVCRTVTTYTADVLPGYSNYHTTETTKCSGETATSSGPGSIYCGDPYFGYLCGDPYMTSSPYISISDTCLSTCTVTLADYAIDNCAGSNNPCCGDPTCGTGLSSENTDNINGNHSENAGGPEGDCSEDDQ